jgi:hypothetical protein
MNYVRTFSQEPKNLPIDIEVLSKNTKTSGYISNKPRPDSSDIMTNATFKDFQPWKVLAITPISLLEQGSAKLVRSSSEVVVPLVRKALLELSKSHPEYCAINRLTH